MSLLIYGGCTEKADRSLDRVATLCSPCLWAELHSNVEIVSLQKRPRQHSWEKGSRVRIKTRDSTWIIAARFRIQLYQSEQQRICQVELKSKSTRENIRKNLILIKISSHKATPEAQSRTLKLNSEFPSSISLLFFFHILSLHILYKMATYMQYILHCHFLE